MDARLKAMVESGKMTQDQADQYKKWWQARPDTAPLLPDRMGRHAGRGFAPGMRWPAATTTTPAQ